MFLCKCVCGPCKVVGVQSLLHERQKKSYLPLAICMYFMVLTMQDICLSFLSWGKEHFVICFSGKWYEIAPIAVRPPWVQSANSLSSLVNKTAWKWKNLPSLRNSPDVLLAGGRDRPPQRLCLTFFSVSSYYSCIFIDFSMSSLRRQLGMSSQAQSQQNSLWSPWEKEQYPSLHQTLLLHLI